jgi:zinc transporter 5/7
MLPLSHKDNLHRGLGSRIKEKLNGWMRLIFSDRNSRNLFLFLLLNLSFAFVELIYGVWSNSLGECLVVKFIATPNFYFIGLISDSFHMFFDCTGLLAGLAASVITKWKANEKYSYGYVRAEVLAGFVNGLFLLFISFFIMSEAVERAIEPPEVGLYFLYFT